jgi:hypothetical protein
MIELSFALIGALAIEHYIGKKKRKWGDNYE